MLILHKMFYLKVHNILLNVNILKKNVLRKNVSEKHADPHNSSYVWETCLKHV